MNAVFHLLLLRLTENGVDTNMWKKFSRTFPRFSA